MATTTKAADSNTSSVHYRPEITINPPLTDAVAKSLSGTYLKLRQNKDEDVTFDPIEGIVVVSRNVTEVQSTNDLDYTVYGEYKSVKKEVAAIVKGAKAAKSEVTGYVLFLDTDSGKYFRLQINGSKVEPQAAMLGWPDGTSTPIPEGDGLAD